MVTQLDITIAEMNEKKKNSETTINTKITDVQHSTNEQLNKIIS